jgi:hypothetical protein
MANDKDEQTQTEDFSFQESVLFDKSILTLAGGVFGLSLTFIKQIPHTNCVLLLFISWILFVLSIVSTLFSMLTSQDATRAKVEYLKGLSKSYNGDRYALFTLWLNRLSAIFFISGAFLLSIFVFINLQ